MKKSVSMICLSLLVLTCIGLASCGNNTTGGNKNNTIAGTKWTLNTESQDVKRTVEFKKDGNFLYSGNYSENGPSAEIVDMIKGTYKVDGDKIIPTITWAVNQSMNNPSNLTFTISKDGKNLISIEGVWSKAN